MDSQQQRREDNEFYLDIIQGLRQTPKRLPSKYFYDTTGDRLFQAIMAAPDYYPTRCEMEIFTAKAQQIVESITTSDGQFELIELGPGNCAKSIHLLKALRTAKIPFNYVPIDISAHIINTLQSYLPNELPGLLIKGLTGEYFECLSAHCASSQARKVVMCLGGNIGNMETDDCRRFCQQLRSYLKPGDQCIIGFDLMKHPAIIRQAYDDRQGLTKAFNLNLLTRINRELKADFDTNRFDHYCSYDPLTGAAKSFLVALEDMTVHFPDTNITFEKNECIWTEISQKYSPKQIYQIAENNGFIQKTEFLDTKSWFMDAIWTAI